MVDITELSEQDLQLKIKNTRYEVNRVSAALKRYEEELERRKLKVQLGVPLEDIIPDAIFNIYKFAFASEESLLSFNVRLNDYVEALQKLAKGEPIDIKALVPLMKKGWVAMDRNGHWYWYENKPKKDSDQWVAGCSTSSYLFAFNLKPTKDWRISLMECGL